MKVIRNIFVILGIVIITYGAMININRYKYPEPCTTLYVVKDEEQDHILDNSDFMVVRNNNQDLNTNDLKNEYNTDTLSSDFFKYMNRRSNNTDSVYDSLTEKQKAIVQGYREKLTSNELSREKRQETYHTFTQDLIAASPMYTLVENSAGIKTVRELQP